MRDARPKPRDGRSGFSMIELLVVIGIIGAMAAIALPAIGRYFRLYKIRGAQSQVAGDLQSARNKAISKNVNYGVDFIVENASTYWIHLEDDQTTARSTARKTLNFSAPVGAQSIKGVLPGGIQFATTTAQCPNATGNPGFTAAPTTGWLQYERLGNICTAGCGTTPSGSAPLSAVYSVTGSDLVICVYQPGTTLRRTVQITPGGRVTANP